MVLSNLIVENQILFARLPEYAGHFLGLIGISALLLSFLSLARAFGKRLVSGVIVFGVVAVLIGGIFGGISSGFTAATYYTNEYSKTQNIVFEAFTGSTLDIDYQDQETRNFSIPTPTHIDIRPSLDGKLRAESIAFIRAKDSVSGQSILTHIRDLTLTQTGSMLRISPPVDGNFAQELPLSLLYREVKIYVPSGVQVDTGSIEK